MEQIIQIMPATDWYSVYDDDSNGRDEELIHPVVCWVLLEDEEEGLRRVDAIDDGTKGWDGEFASEVSNFNRFFYSKDKQPLFRVLPVSEQKGGKWDDIAGWRAMEIERMKRMHEKDSQ